MNDRVEEEEQTQQLQAHEQDDLDAVKPEKKINFNGIF
jgi:hypothetical protein